MPFDNFINDSIQNEKNNRTNLKYIKIYSLFGRYDVEIPFEKKINIYIGENGLGKTTILNCIYYILDKKFSKLLSIQFSKIEVAFKNEDKDYVISFADIMEYVDIDHGKRILPSYRYRIPTEMFYNIEKLVLSNDMTPIELTKKIREYAIVIAPKIHLPIYIVENELRRYFYKYSKRNREGKGNKNKVIELEKALDKNVDHRIIYLPTYRRIEDDFTALSRKFEEDESELLIRFGMSDVQQAMDRILSEIRSIAMQGFTAMTGVLLKEYVDENVQSNLHSLAVNRKDMNYETVKIVLDRVGDAIEGKYKEKILKLVKEGIISSWDKLYLWNLIGKLIDNYDLQKSYDNSIKQFTDTCNHYFNEKHFNYNPSMLTLQIYLNNSNDERTTEKNGENISVSHLSSGEKQIVSLFSKLYLESEEKSILIIDEPELSLSLSWQKKLIPDIIKTGNCDLLLTVTHSPFIFDNEFDNYANDMHSCISKIR